VVARTRVIRARLTEAEYQSFENKARASGFANSSEYLRSLALGPDVQDLRSQVDRLDKRLTHVETQIAEVWLKGSTHEEQAGRPSQ
jgi:hypothetical protein